MPVHQQQPSVYCTSYNQQHSLLPSSHHNSTASLPMSHQQHTVSLPLSHQPQTASLPMCHQQHTGYRSASFVDSNPAFQDLSESFKSLYKSVFESPQGMTTVWSVFFICFNGCNPGWTCISRFSLCFLPPLVRQMQENFRVKGKKLYFGFVDLEKASDRVPREVIRSAMRMVSWELKNG